MFIRVLIADDQPRARRSLNALLTAMRWGTPAQAVQPAPNGHFAVEIIGEAEDGPQTVDQVWALQPDVVLMDLLMHTVSGADTVSAPEPRLDGLATIRMIKRQWPAVRIVVLTMFATDRASVLAAGADAFLLKGCPTIELLDAMSPSLVAGHG